MKNFWKFWPIIVWRCLWLPLLVTGITLAGLAVGLMWGPREMGRFWDNCR